MDVQAKTKLKLRLLDNGIDFLRRAVLELHPESPCDCDPFGGCPCEGHKWPEPDPAAAKYAILDAYAGVVLLLKERLRRKDPELLKQPTKYTADATVTYHGLLKRLKSDVGYELPAGVATMLDAVREFRHPLSTTKSTWRNRTASGWSPRC